MRQDQFDVEVQVDKPNKGGTIVHFHTWDKLAGGEIDSEELTYKPGNMGKRISLGGSETLGNVTVSVLHTLEEAVGWVNALRPWVGKAVVTIVKIPLDVDGNAGNWKPLTYTGRLKKVTPPEHDSESNDAALLELETTIFSVT